MDHSSWISSRLRLRGSSNANATGVTIAVVGVALAIVVMECALAVSHGFRNQITDRIMGFDGQVSVLPSYVYETGKSAPEIALKGEVADIIEATLPHASATIKVSQPGILKTDQDFSGAYFVGYGDGYDYAFEKGAVVEGELPDFSGEGADNSIAVSKSVANKLQIALGDKINAYFVVNEAVKARRFTIAAIYDTGFSDYDNTIVFAPISTLQRIAGIESHTGSQVTVYLPKGSDIAADAAALQQAFLDAYKLNHIEDLYPVDNVRHTGAVFFNWLDLIDTNVVVIFLLMACVAAFTLISSMFILILDRIPTIGLLRSLGATKAMVRRIFVTLALKIIATGMLFGNAIGLGMIFAQQHWSLLKLDPNMYYLPAVPVDINIWQILLLNLGTSLVAALVLVLPSSMASSISPASTMRFE